MSTSVQSPSSAGARSPDEARFYRLQFLGFVALVTLLVLALGAYFIGQHIRDFQRDQKAAEARIMAEQEHILMREVDNANDYLRFVRSRTDEVLRQQIRAQVDMAFQVAESIYERDHTTHPPEKVQRAIIETLRNIRFFDGRGYFFIDGMDGTCLLLPTNPEREGTSLLDNRDDQGIYIMRSLIQSVQEPEKEGYSRYRWYSPLEHNRMAEKVAFARLFEPYQWIIGTGEYTVVIEQALQREALTRMRAVRFGENGYLAVVHQDGRILVSPTVPGSEGRPLSEITTAAERTVVQSILKTANAGGGIVRYDWPKPGNRIASPKLSYVSPPDEWGWVVVAGVYVDELAESMAQRQAELTASVRTRILTTITILLVAMGAASGLSWLLIRGMRRIVGFYQTGVTRRESMLRERGRQLYLANFFVDHVSEIVILADAGRCITYVNPFGCDVLGEPVEALVGQPADLLDPFRPDEGGPADGRFETDFTTPGGRTLTLEVTASTVQYEGQQYYCAIARDVTARRQTEWELSLSAKVFDNASEGMFITDAQNRIVAVNDAFSDITGFTRSDVLGKNPHILSSGRHGPEFYSALWADLKATGHWTGEIWNKRKNGEVFPEWLNIQLVRNERGEAVNHIAAFTDISETREQQERIRHLAQYDFLTDLPNRFLLRDRLERAILSAQRSGRKVAVLFLDLDRFKTINDSLGHVLGDALLQAVSRRLSAAVRASDTVSRQGGDEFVVLIPDLDRAEAAAGVAANLLTSLSTPYHLEGHELQITPSIGIAIHPDDGSTIDALLKNADMAMYAAKEAGRATYRFFTPELNQRATERLWMENNLRRAIERGEMELHFQPQLSIDGTRLLGCEALVRWRQPDGRLIPPGQFIPVAEETGLIVSLGDWVLEEACKAAADLRQRLGPLTMAINLSAVQFHRANPAHRVEELLQRYGLPPDALELEVTESILMDDADEVVHALERFRTLGVPLAIDDFGTGYSSLSYLKRFHADKLKIDRSFVQGLGRDGDSTAIAEAIVAMAHSLDMATLAEGVETEEQRLFLSRLGCGQVQGFLFGQPMPFDAFLAAMAGRAVGNGAPAPVTGAA